MLGCNSAGVTLNPTGYSSVLSHPISWDPLSPIQFDSVNPTVAVESPLID